MLQQLSEFPVTLDFNSLHHKALMQVLEEAMGDQNGWIFWWLYEDVEKVVTWDENGEEIKADLTDVNALYDFLVREIRDAQAEQLPLRDYDEEALFPEYANKVMELNDFQMYFESTLRYVSQSNIVLHINESAEGKYVLMPIQCYERMMGYAVDDRKEGQHGAGTGDRGN